MKLFNVYLYSMTEEFIGMALQIHPTPKPCSPCPMERFASHLSSLNINYPHSFIADSRYQQHSKQKTSKRFNCTCCNQSVELNVPASRDKPAVLLSEGCRQDTVVS